MPNTGKKRRRSAVPREKSSPQSAGTQIQRIVKRIVRSFQPNRIILFGSQARGDAGVGSDVDLLIVMPVSGCRREKSIEIRGTLHDFEIAVDIIVTTPEEFAWRKDVVGTIEWPATHEGKVLYARA